MGIDPAIDITTEQRKTVLSLLEKHLPNTTVWVYGSRVKWTTHTQSDLDMVVFATPEQNSQVFDLREALEESNLPFRVDLFVWDDVPERFRKHIKQDYVVFSDNADVDLAGKNWLYHPQLPRHWKRKSLYAMAQWVNGLAFREIQFSTTGKPVIKIAEIKGGISGQTKFTQQTFDESVRICSGDLLFSWSGQPETSIDAFWWRGPEGWLNQHVFRVTPINGVDSTFFFYLLRYLKPNFVAIARNKQTTGLGHVTKRDLENIEAALPDLSEQRAIADILGTLDDKIELNRRMNETLEEMARALFKSWFVDFLPVRAKQRARTQTGDPVRAKAALKTSPAEASDWTVERASAYLDSMDKDIIDLFPDRFVDSELGEIPEGWEVGKLSDIVTRLTSNENPGLSPSTEFSHFSIPAYDEGQLPKRELGKEIKSSKSRVPQNVVLLSKLNPEIERVWLADALPTEKAICSTEFLVLLARPPFTRSYVYCIARSPLFREQMKSLVTGTSKSHQRSPANAVLSIDTVLPSQEIAEAFELSASRVLRRVLDNRKESRTLATLRDALMPKLVSGEMRICQGHKNRTRKK